MNEEREERRCVGPPAEGVHELERGLRVRDLEDGEERLVAPGRTERAESGVAVAEWPVRGDREGGAPRVEKRQDVGGIRPAEIVLLRILKDPEQRLPCPGPERPERGEGAFRRCLERGPEGCEEERVELARGGEADEGFRSHDGTEAGERVQRPLPKRVVRQERQQARCDLRVSDRPERFQGVDLEPEVPLVERGEERRDGVPPSRPTQREEQGRPRVRVPFSPRGGLDRGDRLRTRGRTRQRGRRRDPHVGGRVLERPEERRSPGRPGPRENREARGPVSRVVVVRQGDRAGGRHAWGEASREGRDGSLPDAVVLVSQQPEEELLRLLARHPAELAREPPPLRRLRGHGRRLDSFLAHASPLAPRRSTSSSERKPASSATTPETAPRPGGGGATRSAGNCSTPSTASTRSA